MLTRPQVTRPRPRPEVARPRPRPRPEDARPRPRPRPEVARPRPRPRPEDARPRPRPRPIFLALRPRPRPRINITAIGKGTDLRNKGRVVYCIRQYGGGPDFGIESYSY